VFDGTGFTEVVLALCNNRTTKLLSADVACKWDVIIIRVRYLVVVVLMSSVFLCKGG